MVLYGQMKQLFYMQDIIMVQQEMIQQLYCLEVLTMYFLAQQNCGMVLPGVQHMIYK